MVEIKWSAAEKKIARRAFAAAYDGECAAIMARLKQQAARAETPEDLWAIQDEIAEQREGLDRKYDFRYSQLIFALVPPEVERIGGDS